MPIGPRALPYDVRPYGLVYGSNRDRGPTKIYAHGL